MDSVDLNDLIASSRKIDSNLLKKKRKHVSKEIKGEQFETNQSSDYPYEVDDDDHCETPIEAYNDVSYFLSELSKELNKSPETLSIYDPYYCEGRVVEHLSSLGFKNVYNRKEDFYAVNSSNRLPNFDVMVTNPPYSGDNVEKLLAICMDMNKPFLLLMPNYVYTKDYYDRVLQHRMNSIFYVVPKKGRYLYTTPKGRRQNKSGKYTAPFPTFWYCSLMRFQTTILERFKRQEASCMVAKSTTDIPLESAPDNDPRKKKLRNSLKRLKHNQRKKAKQVITNKSSTTS